MSSDIGAVVVTCSLADVYVVQTLLVLWAKSGRALPETFCLNRQADVVTLYAARDNYAISQRMSTFLMAEFRGKPIQLLGSAVDSMAEALSLRSGEVPRNLLFQDGSTLGWAT